MSFNHHQYNNQYVLNARDNGEAINDAEQKYGVRIIEADVAEGETYWKVISFAKGFLVISCTQNANKEAHWHTECWRCRPRGIGFAKLRAFQRFPTRRLRLGEAQATLF